MVVFLLESVPGEIRDSAFVSPDSIRRHRRGLAVLIPEVDIRRLVLMDVGLYVVPCIVVVLIEVVVHCLVPSPPRGSCIYTHRCPMDTIRVVLIVSM